MCSLHIPPPKRKIKIKIQISLHFPRSHFTQLQTSFLWNSLSVSDWTGSLFASLSLTSPPLKNWLKTEGVSTSPERAQLKAWLLKTWQVIQLLKVLTQGNAQSVYCLINLLRGDLKSPHSWMREEGDSEFLRGDKLSKLQAKTIMLISGCSHQSSRVNAVSTHHVYDPPPQLLLTPASHSHAYVRARLQAAVRVCLESRSHSSWRLGTVGEVTVEPLADQSWNGAVEGIN